ncbi:zinc-finger-containing protein [Glaesserella parasuis]|uniref:zinc-finger-containing protein n=1 Tax=Glaesserella parasuis TaxID=738 RepID=UPI0013666887|nr:DUF3268 family zinc-finger domain-containing protein [Glaesserella parasuis]MCT8527090.1 DUF3268 family zinc-finger domain-containing protein [Glaesserella parasuis]MCT8529215.1 DUF3268 family zinc-finger domain-containing protein [Glaesserella parasuis]MCT8532417.1 DUF3268 family zinc-finger domain-containing protein [Glaesserella parasuis]MCT8536414.1 DUF3268 family zinc-finger domain-containing protein [Glaesserella parasuis]
MTEFIQLSEVTPVCPYCGSLSEKVTGKKLYPHRKDLYKKTFYECEPCDAYVGCHPNTEKPLGRLANAELRKAKKEAHSAFDPLWKKGYMKRGRAYLFLSKSLGIPQKDTHIGMFDVETCNRVKEIAGDELFRIEFALGEIADHKTNFKYWR